MARQGNRNRRVEGGARVEKRYKRPMLSDVSCEGRMERCPSRYKDEFAQSVKAE
jgi:hypothetical protein